MSVSRVGRPKEARMLPPSRAGLSRIARNTWEGCTLPTWHADPAETATPSRSSAATSVWASIPSKARFDVWGRRGLLCPFTRISSIRANTPASIGPVDLVSRERDQVKADTPNIEWDFSEGLRRIGVEKDSPFLQEDSDLIEGEENPRLVIGVHQRDENRVGADRSPELFQVEHPLPVDGQNRHREAPLLEHGTGFKDGRVLHRRGDNVPPPLLVRQRRPEKGQIIRLGPGGDEDDLILVGRAQQPGQPLSGLLQSRLRLSPRGMSGARIAEDRLKVRLHGLPHPWINGGRGVVIELDFRSHRASM